MAFQQIVFRNYEDGETRVNLVFVANRPERITNVSVEPVDWSASSVVNTLSFGWTAPIINSMRPALRRFPFRFGSVDPVSVGVELANILTGGFAARRLCISREQLEKTFLVKHFDQHHDMISGGLSRVRIGGPVGWEACPWWRILERFGIGLASSWARCASEKEETRET